MRVLKLTMSVLAAVLATAVAVSPDVQLTSGPIQGYETDLGYIWQGIPYAEPPTGNRRWQNPAPVASWTDVKATKAFGPACPQTCNLPPAACQAAISEDCLFINVYAPKNAQDSSVMVFFHGGRFEQGSEGVALYDGRHMANNSNTVVVTVNYRLGVLGFMTLPSGFTGNYAMLDQRLALQWVQDNIAQFGGNPKSVTIFGQSAGASSVSFHLTSPKSFDLFHGAVLESSPYSLPLLTPDAAYKHYEHFASETNCSSSDTACLMRLSWQEIAAAQKLAEKKIYLDRPLVLFFPWTPVIDQKELTADPLTLINQGQYNKVPVVIGNVAEEAWIFVYEAFPKLSKLEAEAVIDVIFRNKHEPKDIFDLYKLPESADDYRPWVAVLASDFVIRCSSRNVSTAMAQHGTPVYRYEFNHSWAVRGAWGPNYTFCEGHACHGVELPFVFDSASLTNYTFTAAENTLSYIMSTTWGTFGTTANPNGPGLPQWPEHTADSDQILWYSTVDTKVLTDFRKEYCDFWDSQGYIF